MEDEGGRTAVEVEGEKTCAAGERVGDGKVVVVAGCFRAGFVG